MLTSHLRKRLASVRKTRKAVPKRINQNQEEKQSYKATNLFLFILYFCIIVLDKILQVNEEGLISHLFMVQYNCFYIIFCTKMRVAPICLT